jgi:hypothetical protein
VNERAVVGTQRGADIDAADLVTADDQPVAATGQQFAVQPGPLHNAAVGDERQPGAQRRGNQLRRLKFDVHVEEVFGGQAVEVR